MYYHFFCDDASRCVSEHPIGAAAYELSHPIDVDKHPIGVHPIGVNATATSGNTRVMSNINSHPIGDAPDGAYNSHPIGDASDGAAYIAHSHLHYVIFNFKCHNVSCPDGVLLIDLFLYFCASLSVFDESKLKSMTDYK